MKKEIEIVKCERCGLNMAKDVFSICPDCRVEREKIKYDKENPI